MGAMEDDSKAPARAPGGFRRVIAACKDIFVAAVNPRFGRFSYAFTLAVLVGVVTVGALIAIFISLAFKCEKTCSSIPVGALPDKVKETILLERLGLVKSNPLQCYGYTTSDWFLLQLDFQTEKDNTGLNATSLNLAEGFTWEPQLSSVSACSWLHFSEKARRQWAIMSQAMMAFFNATLGQQATWQQPQLPVQETLAYNKALAESTSRLFQEGEFLQEWMPEGLVRQCMDDAGVRRAREASDSGYQLGDYMHNTGWTVFKNDHLTLTVNFTDSDSGGGWYPRPYNPLTVTLQAELQPQVSIPDPTMEGHMSAASCDINSGSRLTLSAGLEFLSALSMAQSMCSNSFRGFEPKLVLRACQQVYPDGPYATKLCIKGTKAMRNTFSDVDIDLFYNVSNLNCTAQYPTAEWRDTCEIAGMTALAAAAVLLESAAVLGNWMPQGVSTINGDKGNATDVQNWWMQTFVYCCKCSYPDLLASLGSALGYQGYLEIGAAALIMTLYLSMYKTERDRLNLDAFGVARIATEMADVDKGDGTGDGEDPDTGAVTTVMVTASSAPLRAVQMVDTPASPKITRKSSRKVKGRAVLPEVS